MNFPQLPIIAKVMLQPTLATTDISCVVPCSVVGAEFQCSSTIEKPCCAIRYNEGFLSFWSSFETEVSSPTQQGATDCLIAALPYRKTARLNFSHPSQIESIGTVNV